MAVRGEYDLKMAVKPTNPYRIGDRLEFCPDARTIGWIWPTFERIRLKPGDTGIVTRIEKLDYIYLDDERGGFHWECFKYPDR